MNGYWPWFMLMFAGLFVRREQEVIGYLQAVNQVLREELEKARGKKRLLLSPCRKLTRWAKIVGRKVLSELGPLFTLVTLV